MNRFKILFAVLIALPSLCFGQGSTEAVVSLANGLNITGATTDRVGFHGVTPIAQSANSKTSRQVLEDSGLIATGGTDTTVENAVSTSADNTLSDGVDFTVGSSSGTKIGTATTQKLGFFNASPIVQVGATIDPGVVLSNLGLRAAGTAYTLTTSGNVSFTGTIGLGGATTIAANTNLSCAAGTTAVDLSLGTGVFKTTTGVNTIGGTVSLAANKNVACASGSTAVDWSLGTGIFKSTTGLNTLGGKVAVKVIATPVAATGSDVAGAAPLGSGNILTVSSDSAAKGVILVAGVAGDIVQIINTSSTAAIIYPATGGTINGLSANAGVLIPASKGLICICTATNTWFIFDMTAHATAA